MASLFSLIKSKLFLWIIALTQITLVIFSTKSTEMDKFFLLSLLGMLIIAYGVSGSIMPDSDIDMIKELESFDIEEEDDNAVDSYTVPVWRSERGSKVLMNVDSFDAVGDGVTDDTMVHKLFCLEIWFLQRQYWTKVFILQSGFQEGMGDCLQHFKISSFGAKRKEISGECNHF